MLIVVLILYGMIVYFYGDQIFVDFLFMKFYMHGICSTWFLDIRISDNLVKLELLFIALFPELAPSLHQASGQPSLWLTPVYLSPLVVSLLVL